MPVTASYASSGSYICKGYNKNAAYAVKTKHDYIRLSTGRSNSNIAIFSIGAVVILVLILAVGILSFLYCRRAIRVRKDSELANRRRTVEPEESPEPIYDYLDDVIENAAVTMVVLTEPEYVENIVVPEPGEPQYVNSAINPESYRSETEYVQMNRL